MAGGVGAAGEVVGVLTTEPPLPFSPATGGEGMAGGLTCPPPAGMLTPLGPEGGTALPKCLVSFMCVVSDWRLEKLSLHQTHLKMSLLLSGPRLIHWDCHALWRGPKLGLGELGEVADLLLPPLDGA